MKLTRRALEDFEAKLRARDSASVFEWCEEYAGDMVGLAMYALAREIVVCPWCAAKGSICLMCRSAPTGE